MKMPAPPPPLHFLSHALIAVNSTNTAITTAAKI
jgi:hypothetical protein